jgi:hypothetical protein
VWWLGWLVILLIALAGIAEATVTLLPQPYGWAGLIGVVVAAALFVTYWGIWWQRHREYFSPEGVSPSWRPGLTPLRWFGIGMFVLGAIFIRVASLASALHK